MTLALSPRPDDIVRIESGEPGNATIVFSGKLDADSTALVWKKSLAVVSSRAQATVIVDASRVDYCDGSGISLFLKMMMIMEAGGGRLEIQGLRPQFQRLLDEFKPADFNLAKQSLHGRLGFFEEVGRASSILGLDLKNLIGFVGELFVKLTGEMLHPHRIRWRDAFYAAESTGVNALPIVLLISFLVGLIMSFQAAIPMRMFGATIYVADLIALSMVRELGPLMTAIVLAGRSGSAFAAELGTMTVNEEIDALTTMGLDPVRFLVVPRVLAAVAMTPALTVFSNVVGIAGGAVVLLSLGYPLVAYFNQVVSAITYVDFLGGLVKSFVFGILIAGVGCLRGLQTGTGASAVGDSTTSAVVSAIILIVVTDGIFSVVYFYIGI
jgi:phospholipid/cholesterol/gamma-HCH transport system permease protein